MEYEINGVDFTIETHDAVKDLFVMIGFGLTIQMELPFWRVERYCIRIFNAMLAYGYAQGSLAKKPFHPVWSNVSVCDQIVP